MTRHFCDVCHEPLLPEDNVVTRRIKGDLATTGARVQLEVIVGIDGLWNSGDLCPDCLADVLELRMNASRRKTRLVVVER